MSKQVATTLARASNPNDIRTKQAVKSNGIGEKRRKNERRREKEEDVHDCCGRWKRRNWGCEEGEVGLAREGWGHRWASWRGAHSPWRERESQRSLILFFLITNIWNSQLLCDSLATQTKHALAHAARQKPSLRPSLVWVWTYLGTNYAIYYQRGHSFFPFSPNVPSIFPWKDLFTLSFLQYPLYILKLKLSSFFFWKKKTWNIGIPKTKTFYIGRLFTYVLQIHSISYIFLFELS